MSVKMVALKTFKGREGFIRRKEEFDVHSERRADELQSFKLAIRVDVVDDVEEVDKDQVEEAAKESHKEMAENAKTHAELDALAAKVGADIPGREEAKLQDRKEALLTHLEG